jgi:hypothetical protein
MKIDKEVLRHVLSQVFFDERPVGMVDQWEHKLNVAVTMLEAHRKIELECVRNRMEHEALNTKFRQESDANLNKLHSLQLRCYHFSQYVDNTQDGAPAVCHTCGKVFNADH